MPRIFSLQKKNWRHLNLYLYIFFFSLKSRCIFGYKACSRLWETNVFNIKNNENSIPCYSRPPVCKNSFPRFKIFLFIFMLIESIRLWHFSVITRARLTEFKGLSQKTVGCALRRKCNSDTKELFSKRPRIRTYMQKNKKIGAMFRGTVWIS